MAVAQHELRAEIAHQRKSADWVSELQKAVAAQDALPYMEPPYWYYPVRHALGAALLETNQPAEAEAVYREDLRRNPNNGWSLIGLANALRAQGKDDEAKAVQAQFDQAWARADVKITGSRI